jgi:ATP-dependent helicase/nuclease subunit A
MAKRGGGIVSGLSQEALLDQRRAADPLASAWVSASAGSGKTKVLIDRLLNLLLSGAQPYRLLCLTYTKAAAAEMANRLSDQLASWVTLPESDLRRELANLSGQEPSEAQLSRARRLFAQVLDAPGGLHIQTLHAFAQSLLARFPLEAGVAPHFQVMDERDQARLLDQALKESLAKARLGLDADLQQALSIVTARIHEARFGDLMKELASARTRLVHLFENEGGVSGVTEKIRAYLGLGVHETREAVLAAACREPSFDGANLRACVEALLTGSKTDRERANLMAAWLAGDESLRVQSFESYAQAFLTAKLEARSAEKMASKAAKDRLPLLINHLVAEQNRWLCVYDKLRALTVAESTAALLVLAQHVLETYRHLKAQLARLDYDDLIEAARRLIREGTAWVLYKLDGGIDHVLIDEAQDTSPGQWDIVSSFAAEFFAGESARPQPRTLFAVGDVKQSIYSFQGADPESFTEMRARLSEQVPNGGGRWEPVDLVVSFRSTRAVLEAVDAVFAEGEALEGVDLGLGYKRHLAFRAGSGGSVELWPPLEPRALDEPAPWHPPIERIRGDAPSTRMAGLVARRIFAMVNGEMLDSKGRPIVPGDILVLVRRRGGFVADLVRELKRLGVPVAGVDRLIVTEQIAVADLMALARFTLLPEDDLNLAAVLKGPFLDYSEEKLFEVCFGRKGPIWRGLAGKDPKAQAWLDDLLRLSLQLRPHDFFAHILGPLGGRRILQGRLGQEALDAVDEFMALALDFESRHTPSLSDFLAWLSAGKVEIKRDPDPGSGGCVRIMTVHGAKGLQAPIVFLPDTLISPKGRDQLLWTEKGPRGLPLWAPLSADRSQAAQRVAEGAAQAQKREGHRLLYVAMTRAEDRLIIGGWQPKTGASDAWYPLIQAGFERVHAPAVNDPFLAQDPDSPGPEIQRLFCPQQDVVKGTDEETIVIEPSLLPDWARRKAMAEPEPVRPLIPSKPEGPAAAALSPLGSDNGQRFERGLLVHRLLQTLPDLEVGQRAVAAERYLAHQAAHWPEPARKSLISEVLAVLADPAFAPLFGPESQAEVALSGLIGGRALSGQVDRLALVGGEVWIVDFKTNRPVPPDSSGVPELYRRQMDLYRQAAQHVWPERPVRTFLLWTDGPRLMEV